jgi:isopentenyl-diphosphate delta-isomerase
MTGRVEEVVLLNESGEATGAAPRSSVHGTRTPLHLAFSCYVFDADLRLLLTQRALSKVTWPGVWTNSFCGHPRPGEAISDAVHRRASRELGMRITDLMLVLPSFRYEASMPDGLRENEMCPVFTAVATTPPIPAADEVAQIRWQHWESLLARVARGDLDVSPWCRRQMAELDERRDPTGGFHEALWAQLPPAARAADSV